MTLLADAAEALAEAERADRKTRLTTASQTRLEQTLRTTWRTQKRGVLAELAKLRTRFPEFTEGRHLREAIGGDDLDGGFDQVAANTSRPLVARLDLELPRAVAAGGDSAHLDLSIQGAFDVHHPDAVNWLRDRSADRVAQINSTTRDRLRTVLSQAADEGWSWQQTGQAIEQMFSGFSTPSKLSFLRTRAELIAVTELAEAYEEGQTIIRDRVAGQGLDVEVSWLTVGDDRVDPDCEANGGQGWIPHGQTFASGVYSPPDHPGCRCSTMSRVAPDEET